MPNNSVSSQSDIADMVGLSVDTIQNYKKLTELIAGERRLRALKLLNYNQIEVRPMSVKDAEHQLNLEISENETRKDFSKKERIDYARRLERIEKVKAQERKENTQFGNNMVSQNSDTPKGRTDDIIADKLGFGSRDTYRKEKYIADIANTTLLSEWDKGDIRAYGLVTGHYQIIVNYGFTYIN